MVELRTESNSGLNLSLNKGWQTLQITPDGFAFDPATGETYTLNRCGRRILQQLQQGQTRAQITTDLADQFGIAQSIAQRDVADFWQQLESFGLIPKTRGIL